MPNIKPISDLRNYSDVLHDVAVGAPVFLTKNDLSEEAQNDLLEIKAYIEEELLNPSAALATVSRITKSLRILQNYAQTGAPLSSIADIESDYRFIVSGNYISFYRAYDSEVFIDRILYARRDYMRILFGDSTTDE